MPFHPVPPDNIQPTINLRAKFLDLAWMAERRVALLITAALTSEMKTSEIFMIFIMGHQEMTFSVKCAILEQIHEVAPIAGLDDETFKLLKKVREFRNDLAHCAMGKGERENELAMWRASAAWLERYLL